jgi:beta-glucanase (GH16 family)
MKYFPIISACPNRTIIISLAAVLLLLGSLPQTTQAQDTWKLVWSDEFSGADNSAPDPAKWVLETGGNGWGNNEWETYTDRLENAHIENGNLVITAINELYKGKDGILRNYTSARLKTQAKFELTYGRVEARLKIPFGQGIWPAFWMLGNDVGTAGWPACGEIDIMENIGKEPSTVHATIHGPGYSGGNGIGAAYNLSGGQHFSDDYHLYAVEWEANVLRFYVDDQLYRTVTPQNLPNGTQWVFAHPFFMILNVAVGGGWPGYPDATTVFPQKMLVDYVRVYQRADVSANLFVPIVLSSAGKNNSFYTSELTLTNRGGQDANIQFSYNPAPYLGSGGERLLTL